MGHEAVVADLMSVEPRIVAPSDRAGAVLREMELSAFRHFPVAAADGRLLGVVSQRDLLRADANSHVSAIMSEDVKTVGPETPAHEAAYLLLRHKIGCLPVVSTAGALVGIITESDFLRVAYTLLGGQVSVDQLELEEREAERV
jgi:CBS domain-containing protein